MTTWNVVNFLVCAGVFCVCFDRLTMTTAKTRRGVRMALSALGATALASAVAPIVWPGFVAMAPALFGVCVLWQMMSMAPTWKHGPPRELHHGTERRTGSDRRNGSRRKKA